MTAVISVPADLISGCNWCGGGESRDGRVKMPAVTSLPLIGIFEATGQDS